MLPGSEGAWKTDTNLWTVPLDGSAAPRCLTSANPAVDTQPVFSPDGRTIAYLAMARPGYEADRQRIVLMDWPAGTTRVLTEAWDRSPGELAWAPDGKTIWCAADNLGQHAIFAVDVKSGAVREVVAEATNSSLNPVRRGVFFLRNSLRGPDELYFAKADGKETRKLTAFNDAQGRRREVRRAGAVQLSRAGTATPSTATSSGRSTSTRRAATRWPSSSTAARRGASATTSTTAGIRRPTPAPASPW